jgi:hypothetical protein
LSNTTSDARKLPVVVDAACGDLTAPSADDMRADSGAEGITPLFDAKELDWICRPGRSPCSEGFRFSTALFWKL